MIHTYRRSEPGLWTVGIAAPRTDDLSFHPLADFDAEWKAACFASFLNGGLPSPAVMKELWPNGPDFTPSFMKDY